jgi:hypothetical protein
MPAGALKSHEHCPLATLQYYESHFSPNISNHKAEVRKSNMGIIECVTHMSRVDAVGRNIMLWGLNMQAPLAVLRSHCSSSVYRRCVCVCVCVCDGLQVLHHESDEMKQINELLRACPRAFEFVFKCSRYAFAPELSKRVSMFDCDHSLSTPLQIARNMISMLKCLQYLPTFFSIYFCACDETCSHTCACVLRVFSSVSKSFGTNPEHFTCADRRLLLFLLVYRCTVGHYCELEKSDANLTALAYGHTHTGDH